MLYKRITSSMIGLILLFSIVLLGERYRILISIAVSAVSVLILYELFCAFGLAQKQPLLIIACGCVTACAFSVYLPDNFKGLFFYVGALTLFATLIFCSKSISFKQISIAWMSIIYVGYFLTHIVFISELFHGRIFIWLVFIGGWITDTFAYFVGSRFGRIKLCPNISPKKTIAGALGGLLGCCVAFLVYGYLIKILFGLDVNYLILIILAIICSVLAELGDLFASVIKRELGLKDFGNIMPGHGGLLDRFDSIIFVAPVVYYFVKFFNIMI